MCGNGGKRSEVTAGGLPVILEDLLRVSELHCSGMDLMSTAMTACSFMADRVAWNDPDYLLLGYLSNWKGKTVPTPLTPNEQYTQVSLWCLVAAPLIFSGDITRLDDFTLSLLTNDEIIEVDQDPLGKAGYRVVKQGNNEVWMKQLEDGSLAVGLFNRGGTLSKITVLWSDLHISGKQSVRDLWRQKDIGIFNYKYSTKVQRHGVVMIRIRPVTK